MNPAICSSCGETYVSHWGDLDGNMCHSCQKDRRQDFGKYHDNYYHFKKKSQYPPVWKEASAEAATKERRKSARIDAAVMKPCSECEQDRPHDPDDYICIICRDGREALPKGYVL
jgi:hypothetical protein